MWFNWCWNTHGFSQILPLSSAVHILSSKLLRKFQVCQSAFSFQLWRILMKPGWTKIWCVWQITCLLSTVRQVHGSQRPPSREAAFWEQKKDRTGSWLLSLIFSTRWQKVWIALGSRSGWMAFHSDSPVTLKNVCTSIYSLNESLYKSPVRWFLNGSNAPSICSWDSSESVCALVYVIL